MELRVAFDQQPTKNWGPQSNNLLETKFCQQLCEFGGKLFPSWESSETPGGLLIPWLQLVRIFQAEDTAELFLDSWHHPPKQDKKQNQKQPVR